MSDNSINKTDSKPRQEKVPQSKELRNKLACFAEEYVREKKTYWSFAARSITKTLPGDNQGQGDK